jgi:hypothetical protein
MSPSAYRSIFPLYNPAAVDIVVFWEIPSQQRIGHILISGLVLGAAHGALQDIIEEAEQAKVKRSIYAETRREKMKLFDVVKDSEWNAEMDPMVVTLQEGTTVEHDFSKGFVSSHLS